MSFVGEPQPLGALLGQPVAVLRPPELCASLSTSAHPGGHLALLPGPQVPSFSPQPCYSGWAGAVLLGACWGLGWGEAVRNLRAERGQRWWAGGRAWAGCCQALPCSADTHQGPEQQLLADPRIRGWMVCSTQNQGCWGWRSAPFSEWVKYFCSEFSRDKLGDGYLLVISPRATWQCLSNGLSTAFKKHLGNAVRHGLMHSLFFTSETVFTLILNKYLLERNLNLPFQTPWAFALLKIKLHLCLTRISRMSWDKQ